MNPDELEKQLADQPRRSVPTAWRSEILAAARAAAVQSAAVNREDSAPSAEADPRSVRPWWVQWLWPCPQAWAGLAAIWVVIAVLQFNRFSNLGGSASSDGIAHTDSAPAAGAPGLVPMSATRRDELARLLESISDPAPPVIKLGPVPTGPRSERRLPPGEIRSDAKSDALIPRPARRLWVNVHRSEMEPRFIEV